MVYETTNKTFNTLNHDAPDPIPPDTFYEWTLHSTSVTALQNHEVLIVWTWERDATRR